MPGHYRRRQNRTENGYRRTFFGRKRVTTGHGNGFRRKINRKRTRLRSVTKTSCDGKYRSSRDRLL